MYKKEWKLRGRSKHIRKLAYKANVAFKLYLGIDGYFEKLINYLVLLIN